MSQESRFQKNATPFLNCTDHSVSGEVYQLMKNQEFDFLVTTPVPSNLEKYYQSDAYISHTDAKKSLFEKAYQIVKKYTLKKKVMLLDSFATAEKTVLDVGAGTGDFLQVCKKNHWNVFGIEPSEKAREIAKSKNVLLEKDLSFFKEQKFDVITLWHVLEHVENLESFIQSLKEQLKENGRLVIAVPNHKSFDAKYYGAFWAAFDVPRHLWHFSQTSIQQLFSKVSLNVIRVLPMKFDAFYVSLLSEKYKNGKMNIFKSFWIGFQSNRKAKKTSEYSSLIYILKNN